jgi:hypothetical protein
LAEATLWADRRGILSHDTALDLHELCGINPAQIHITIPAAYRLQKPVPKLLRQAIDTARRRGQVRGPQLRRLRKMLAARGRR